MGQNFSGYRRVTFDYRTGWSPLDNHEYVGEFRLLNSRHIPPDDYASQYGDAGTYFLTVRAPRGVSRDTVREVLRNEFESGCRCEHDCCGHVQRNTGEPVYKRHRNWVVPVHAFHNV